MNVNVKKGRGRGRRVAGWWLIGCAMLLVAVWVITALVPMSVRVAGCQLQAACGVVVVRKAPVPMVSGDAPVVVVQELIRQRAVDRELMFMEFGMVEWWWWRWRTGPAWYVGAPVWALALACGAAGVGLIRWGWDSRRKGVCGSCGYDLAGLGLGARCPECGRGAKAT